MRRGIGLQGRPASESGRLRHGDGGPRTGQPPPEGAKVAYALQTFAAQAVIAVDNAGLFGALQARTDELAAALDETRALAEVMQAAGSSLDLREVLDASQCK